MEIMRRRSPIRHLLLSLFFSCLLLVTIPLAKTIKPFLPFTNYLLGLDKTTSYLILLGNDTEMRANGGFVGSYAKLLLSPSPTRSLLEGGFDLSFQDIYVPNGQLKGYVTPPKPIQQAFQHGSWELANADWEPDFPTTATTLRWFFVKGNEINPDNLVLLNLSTIKKILHLVGSFSVPEYGSELTPDNLYLFLQGKAELNFFPGSTQKKDALTAVGSALAKKILALPFKQKIEIAQILYTDLQNQNIVINSLNSDFQKLLESQNFAGKLETNTPDTYLLVETNLGANKSSAYISRQTEHQINFQDNKTQHQAKIQFTNSSPEANPNPPFHYGGDYIVYLRFYLPASAQDIRIASGSSMIKITPAPKFGLTEIGFWHTTPALTQTNLTLSYILPVPKAGYSLTLLKQHGLVSSPQTITLNNRLYTTPLTTDFILP